MKKVILVLFGLALCLSTLTAQESIGVGYIYTFDDGSQGVIFYTDGEHGLVVSMQDTKAQWCTSKYAKTDIPDLPNNCEAKPKISQLGEGATYSKAIDELVYSPAVRWCYSLGEGWYLPSGNELCYLFDIANKQKIHSGLISKALRRNGGKALQKGWYWSSSECDRKNAVNIDEDGDIATELKKLKNLVRAVRAF